jgi:hypothetical protein
MTSEKSPITAWAQFFDDVRAETTGKLILIGQYPIDMMILPNSLPVDRLAVLLTARWPREYEPKTLDVRIEIPGQPPIIQPLPLPMKPDFAGVPLSPFSGMIAQAVLQLRFAPLRIGDVIDVWLLTGENELPAGRLRIVEGSQPTSLAGAANQLKSSIS